MKAAVGRMKCLSTLPLVSTAMVISLAAESTAQPARSPPIAAEGATDRAENVCPPGSTAGSILTIGKPIAEVKLIRDGRLVAVYPGRCVLYGDKLTAGPSGWVEVRVARGTRRYGADGEGPVWQPHGDEEQPTGPAGALSSIQTAFSALFGSHAIQDRYAASRDVISRCDDSVLPDAPLSPLSRLPAIPQLIGSDLRTLAVAWRPGGARVKVSLVDRRGSLIASATTCSGALLSLPLPRGRLIPGARLMLTVEDNYKGSLRYPIKVVVAGRLVQPAGPMSEGLLGAWRLAGGDASLGLDALSRLQHGADRSYTARVILDGLVDEAAPAH